LSQATQWPPFTDEELFDPVLSAEEETFATLDFGGIFFFSFMSKLILYFNK
jgi:hypothetical protein